ncbi:MAG: lysine biosynthesis protein LysW [Phycisphaerales bacterium]
MNQSAPTALTTATTACPECAADITFPRRPLAGEVCRCGECSAELEVTSTAPITLALAPEVREDWGE